MGQNGNRRTIIVTGLVILLILVVVFGIIWYLFNFFASKESSKNDIFPPIPSDNAASPSAVSYASPASTPVVTPTPAPTVKPTPTPAPVTQPANTKVYTLNSYALYYPANWGLLTCNNSKNIELDPTSGTDQSNYPCDYAIKPVTILVLNSAASCPGTKTTIGTTEVVKSVVTSGGDTKYRWCTTAAPYLDITHRVSATSKRAYSVKDYSSQIEQTIIANLHLGGS